VREQRQNALGQPIRVAIPGTFDCGGELRLTEGA
jgi:hypothetical protein